jgi:hypothetical protein
MNSLSRTWSTLAAASILAVAGCLGAEETPSDASAGVTSDAGRGEPPSGLDASSGRDASSSVDASSAVDPPTPSGGDASSSRDASTGGGDASSGNGDASTGGKDASGGGADGSTASACVGKAWTTADPGAMGPFQIATDKKVGPLAGYTPDPIYGDEQQHFNVYRPKDLATSGYCHPILVWSNGHTDNPEQNPPKCVVDSAAGKWCGTYPPLINQLASHGFVVVASLSTTTSKGTPLPSKTGLDWILQQAEDPTSPYYHRLDTAHIGALGHSEGGMATCMLAPDTRISAIGTVSGTSTISAVHGPAIFFCGGKEGASVCDGIQKKAAGITDQPSMFINNLDSDHGGWEYQGTKGPTIAGLTAWFRAHLMGDAESRKKFYGASCTYCSDSRVKVERNSLMLQ